MTMLFRTRRIFAALVAPMLLLLFFVATVPSAVQSSLAFVLFAYALAHICFWPPAFAAKFVGRHLQLNSTHQLALLMGGFSLILCFAFATPFVFLHMVPDYGWGAVLRDAVSEAGAAVATYILYCTVFGRKSRNELGEPG
jgi:hypothetical protein